MDEEIPTPLYYNNAVGLENQLGLDRALMIALSTISEQLDYLIKTIEKGQTQ